MSFIPYQIDYKVTGAGKTLGVTKKRVVFKFGFANKQALSDGVTGSGCRGSEHEVVFVLSLASGKRNVLVDGREVHFSQGEKFNRTFDYPFSVRVPGIGSVHARLTADPAPGAKEFNFFINGMSYFHFSKIYELGTPSMRVGQLTEQRSAYNDASELAAPPEERRLIAQAKLESMRELRAREEQARTEEQSKQQMNREEGNLINFDDDIGSAPPPVPAQGGLTYQASSLTLDPALQSPHSFAQDSRSSAGPAYQNYSLNAPPPQQTNAPYGYGGGAPPTSQYPTAQHSQNSSSMMSMTPYSQQPAAAPDPYAQTPAAGSFSSQPSNYGYPQQQQQQPPPPQQQQSFQGQRSFQGQQSFHGAPAPTYDQSQTASFGSPPAHAPPQQFATPQSQSSYGSAPAFAQPPRSSTASGTQPAANPNYGAPYPNSGTGW